MMLQDRHDGKEMRKLNGISNVTKNLQNMLLTDSL